MSRKENATVIIVVVRVMAHVDEGVAIGERVRAGYVAFGERLVPRFSRA